MERSLAVTKPIEPQQDLMNAMTKKLLVQKLMEVQEQISDDESESRELVDGSIAGSQPSQGQIVFDELERERILKYNENFIV